MVQWLAAFLFCGVCQDAAKAITVRASVGALLSGTAANSSSSATTRSMSADGSKIAFESVASNLINGDTNGYKDIFVRDLKTGMTMRASVASNGSQGNGDSLSPSLSADGTKVAFVSYANNLVSADNNGYADIFVRDLNTGTITRVNVSNSGLQANSSSLTCSINADGSKIAFESQADNLAGTDTNYTSDIFVRDLKSGTTVRASVDSFANAANSTSATPNISADGSKVAFESLANNLVGGDFNGTWDIFVRDLNTSTTTRVSINSNALEGNSYSFSPSLNTDGSKVAFWSLSDNLESGDANGSADVFVRDLDSGVTRRVSLNSSGQEGNSYSFSPSLSADGSKVAFISAASNLASGDTNDVADIFVRDLATGLTTLVSVNSNGAQSNRESSAPSLNATGTEIVFSSEATTLVNSDNNGFRDLFVRNLAANTTTLASIGVGSSYFAQGNNSSYSYRVGVSADGTKIAFASEANNLTDGDTNNVSDIFVRDLTTGTTRRISISSDGTQANGGSFSPGLSGDGNKVVFESDASNLVSGDTNNVTDVFLHELTTGHTTRISVNNSGIQGNLDSTFPGVSADGSKVAFESDATNLAGSKTNAYQNIFVRDLINGTTTVVSVDSSGSPSNGNSFFPVLNADGSKVVFESQASALIVNDKNTSTDVFMHDLTTGVTTRVSLDNSGNEIGVNSYNPSLSADGSKVVFSSDSSSSPEIFVRDLKAGTTTLVSMNSSNTNGSGGFFPCLSADGSKVAFESLADNLVSGDTNNARDIFVRDLITNKITRASVDSSNTQANNHSFHPFLSANGSKVAYSSYATNLISDDTNSHADVFLSDVFFGPVLSINDVAVSEGSAIQGVSGSAAFTVTLSQTSPQPVQVNYTTINGTASASFDYSTVSGNLTFSPGEIKKSIIIPLIGDALDESNETFFVNLSAATGAIIIDSQGKASIEDNDASPSVSINDVTIAEGDSETQNATFTVSLSAASGQSVTVNAIPYNGSARTPGDYISGGSRLIFAPGEVSKTFSVPVKGDLLDEPEENFFVILSSPVNCQISKGRGVGTIIDNDVTPSIAIDDVNIGEGNAGQRVASFRLKLSAPSGQIVKVTYATEAGTASAGNDYVEVAPTQIAFTTGNLYAYARVLINGDGFNEPNETFKVNLSSALNATVTDTQSQGTILNDDPVPSLAIDDVSITEGNPLSGTPGTKNLTFTITLSAPSGQAISTYYATADGIARSTSDYVAKTGTLFFAAGQTTGTLNVVINSDALLEGDETLFVLLSGASNASISKARGVGTILNDDASG